MPTAQQIADSIKIGWNVGNSLEVTSGETSWGNPKITQELIDSVSSAGFNLVRIPCAWDIYADQKTLLIDENWLERVKEVVDYCYAQDMYVVLNCHWDGGWLENNVTTAMQDTVNKKQGAYWFQIANYFKDYDEHLLFASANEPNVSNSSQMSVLLSYHQTFIDTVRSTGGNNIERVLIIQGPYTDIDKTVQLLTTMPNDVSENRLMLEIHYYTPWNFCGLTSDETWGNMFYFWGQNYHSDVIPERNATWGEETAVETYFQKMKTNFVNKGYPVLLGEYGVIKRTSLSGDNLDLHIASREYFYRYVTNSAKKHGLIPAYWDNGWSGNNGFALFDRNSGASVDTGAINGLIESALINTPIDKNPKSNNEVIEDFMLITPNPIKRTATIKFHLKKPENFNISIFNILGQQVYSFNSLYSNIGQNTLIWNADKMPIGTYFVKLAAENVVLTRKVMVLH